jgi:hypothetical protein
LAGFNRTSKLLVFSEKLTPSKKKQPRLSADEALLQVFGSDDMNSDTEESMQILQAAKPKSSKAEKKQPETQLKGKGKGNCQGLPKSCCKLVRVKGKLKMKERMMRCLFSADPEFLKVSCANVANLPVSVFQVWGRPARRQQRGRRQLRRLLLSPPCPRNQLRSPQRRPRRRTRKVTRTD